jgi:hypothetical protein
MAVRSGGREGCGVIDEARMPRIEPAEVCGRRRVKSRQLTDAELTELETTASDIERQRRGGTCSLPAWEVLAMVRELKAVRGAATGNRIRCRHCNALWLGGRYEHAEGCPDSKES